MMGISNNIPIISNILSIPRCQDEFAFFGTNDRPCLVTDDPLDNAYPPELSQVESIDNDYPPDHYDPLVEGIDPMLDSPLGHNLPDDT